MQQHLVLLLTIFALWIIGYGYGAPSELGTYSESEDIVSEEKEDQEIVQEDQGIPGLFQMAEASAVSGNIEIGKAPKAIASSQSPASDLDKKQNTSQDLLPDIMAEGTGIQIQIERKDSKNILVNITDGLNSPLNLTLIPANISVPTNISLGSTNISFGFANISLGSANKTLGSNGTKTPDKPVDLKNCPTFQDFFSAAKTHSMDFINMKNITNILRSALNAFSTMSNCISQVFSANSKSLEKMLASELLKVNQSNQSAPVNTTTPIPLETTTLRTTTPLPTIPITYSTYHPKSLLQTFGKDKRSHYHITGSSTTVRPTKYPHVIPPDPYAKQNRRPDKPHKH